MEAALPSSAEYSPDWNQARTGRPAEELVLTQEQG